LGKLLQCSLYALYKRSGFGDFAQYVEIFGQPVRIIYYDAYDTQTKNELRKILNESGGSLAMMVPKQAKFEMLDGKTSNGTGELQTRLIGACNDEMSIAILGNTETSKSSGSSGYAQSKTHEGQQLEITKSDLKFVEKKLNQKWFKDVLASYGFPVDGKFEYEKELDLDKLKTRMEIDKFVAEKVPVGDDYYYETYGVPKPDNYNELKAAQVQASPAAPNASPATSPAAPAAKDKPTGKQPTAKEKQNLVDSVLDFFGLAPTDNNDAIGAPLEF
jgi:phage gp29-like protein